MDDDFVYLYIDSSQKLKIYILDNLESQLIHTEKEILLINQKEEVSSL